MSYRVILTRNGEYKQTLHRCKTRNTSFVNFNRIKEENVVLFERKYINYNKILPVKYKIYLVKDYHTDDKPRLVRDRFGKLIDEPRIFGLWTVLNDSEYNIEETFWLYGYNPLTERKNIVDIVTKLVFGMGNTKLTKQVVVVSNKLLIYHEEQFDMVICKCKKDAQRLHHALNKAATDNKIKGLYFMGTAKNKMVGEYYDIIQKHTNWSNTKIWRTTTRP
jgi:hypothetical protein